MFDERAKANPMGMRCCWLGSKNCSSPRSCGKTKGSSPWLRADVETIAAGNSTFRCRAARLPPASRNSPRLTLKAKTLREVGKEPQKPDEVSSLPLARSDATSQLAIFCCANYNFRPKHPEPLLQLSAVLAGFCRMQDAHPLGARPLQTDHWVLLNDWRLLL